MGGERARGAGAFTNFPNVEFLDFRETMEVADTVDGRESDGAMLMPVAVPVETEVVEMMEMDFLEVAELGWLS